MQTPRCRSVGSLLFVLSLLGALAACGDDVVVVSDVGNVKHDDEAGFTPLADGTLDKWVFIHKVPARENPAFRVVGNTVSCRGRPVGYMRTREEHERFTLRFDWRYERPEKLEDDKKFGGNSGYLLFVTDDEVWPRSIEVQGMNRDAAGIIPIKTKAKFTTDKEARARAIKPVGEWNTMEIVVTEKEIRALLNGTLISTVTERELHKGHIGFQSEGAEIQWRNIRIRKEP